MAYCRAVGRELFTAAAARLFGKPDTNGAEGGGSLGSIGGGSAGPTKRASASYGGTSPDLYEIIGGSCVLGTGDQHCFSPI